MLGLVLWLLPKKTVNKPDSQADFLDLSKINKEDSSKPLAKIPAFKKENKKVILITLDTAQPNLGVYGYPRNTSEKIDAFAKEKDSIVFKNAYTPVPETLPAHMALFTGLYPGKLGFRTNVAKKTDKIVTSIPRVFKENGYSTAGFYSSVVFSPDYNIDLGFDKIDPPLEYRWSDRVEIAAQETNEKVFNWLDEHSKEDFFLWVHYYEAHNPYTPFCVSGLYSKGLKPANPAYKDGGIDISYQNLWPSIKKEDYQYLNAIYDEEIYCLDKEFSRLMSKLKSLGIYDDSTIIVFGDHGESFDHQTLFHSLRLYQSQVRVPLIVKSPVIKSSSMNNVSLLDIFPTLVEYFNLKTDQLLPFDGISLSRLSRNSNRAIIMETAGPYFFKSNKIGYGLVFNNFKFIDNSRFNELYDLDKDSGEEKNLIESVKPKEIKLMKELINKYEDSLK